MSNVPSHNPRASLTKSKMVSQLEKLQFFFEDESKEAFYATILEKLFDISVLPKPMWGVYCLGGKNNVIKYCQNSSGRSFPLQLYVVDKDLDDLHGIKQNTRNLYYWNQYEIENYLLHERAFVFAICSFHRDSPENVRSKLSFNEILTSAKGQLVEFTQASYVARELGKKNTSNLSRFCNIGQGLNRDNIEAFVTEIFDSSDSQAIQIQSSEQLEAIKRDDRHLPGKYLLCDLIGHVSAIFNTPLPHHPMEHFIYNLALHLEPDALDDQFRALIADMISRASEVVSTTPAPPHGPATTVSVPQNPGESPAPPPKMSGDDADSGDGSVHGQT